MVENVAPEVVTTDLEVIGAENADQRIGALIALASRLPELGKAMDAIRTFILSRALPEDWVAFKDKESGEFKCELSGAAAERVAADIGISFVDWKEPRREEGADSGGPYYTWWYECSTLFRGRRLEKVQGRAGCRDRFFGKAHGQWKKAEEVNEGDVKMAARRNCMKEGVKLMLGLRRIPRSQIERLGLDPSKIKVVEFERTGAPASGAASSGSAPASGSSLISEAQLKRLYAIFKGAQAQHGLDENDMKTYLTSKGFSSSKEITRDKYDEICNAIGNGLPVKDASR